MVIKKAVIRAGYTPVLAANEERPNAINDEIRAHLTFDPMVVVDLGGMSPESDPNPNVMYELGIRHALSLPLVMMSWRNQRLPFDVGNQRVIMETRDLVDIDVNKSKLISFIEAATQGHFYRPMDAVGRAATLELASASLSKDSLLGILAQEVRDLKSQFTSAKRPSKGKTKSTVSIVDLAIPNGRALVREHRRRLYKIFKKAGGTPATWSQFLHAEASNAFLSTAQGWNFNQLSEFVRKQGHKLDLAKMRL